MLVELLDVFLSRADHVKAELEGVGARSWEVGRYADGEDFAMGKVDELGGDGCEGDAELDVADVVEGHRAREAIAVAWVGTVCGQERVGELVSVGLEGKGVVDVGSEVCGVLGNVRGGKERVWRETHANGHEDKWQDEPRHLGTLLRCLRFETVWKCVGMRRRGKNGEHTFCGGEPEKPDGEGVELALVWPAVDGVFVEAFADEGVDKVGETGCVEPAAILSVIFEQHGEAGPEGGEDVICVDVAAADAPECAVVGEELVAAAGSVEVSETAGGCGIVEGDTEDAGKEVGVRLEVEQVVKVLRGEEEWEDRGWGCSVVVVKLESDLLEYFEGETEDGGCHGGDGGEGRRDGRGYFY